VNFKSFDTKDTKDTKETSTKVPENQPQSLDTEDTEHRGKLYAENSNQQKLKRWANPKSLDTKDTKDTKEEQKK